MDILIFCNEEFVTVRHPHYDVVTVPTKMWATDRYIIRPLQSLAIRYYLYGTMLGNQRTVDRGSSSLLMQLQEFLYENRSEREIWPSRVDVELTVIDPNAPPPPPEPAPSRPRSRAASTALGVLGSGGRFRIPDFNSPITFQEGPAEEATAPSESPIQTTTSGWNVYGSPSPYSASYWSEGPSFSVPETHLTPVTPTPTRTDPNQMMSRLRAEMEERERRARIRNPIIPRGR